MRLYINFLTITFLFTTVTVAQDVKLPWTVEQVMKSIRKNVKPHWFETRTDTIVIGNARDTVTGIATCMFVDMNVLKKAVTYHCNLIVTHEPTFYTATDHIEIFMKDDPVLTEKTDYIKAHHLVIYRFHDNAHRNDPNLIMQGLSDDLGWKVVNRGPWILEIKKQKLSVLADSLKKHFKLTGIRIIGDPDLEITRIGLVPGLAPTAQMHIGVLQQDDVDAILVGEAREWEDYIYVRDAQELGKKKAAIFIGHYKSEEPGMQYCAGWLQTFIKRLRIVFIKNDNFWWTPESF